MSVSGLVLVRRQLDDGSSTMVGAEPGSSSLSDRSLGDGSSLGEGSSSSSSSSSREGRPSVSRRLAITRAALKDAIVAAMGLPGITASAVTLQVISSTELKVVIQMPDAQTLADAGQDASAAATITPASITSAVTSPSFTSTLSSDPTMSSVTVNAVAPPTFVAALVDGPSPPPPSPPPLPPPPFEPLAMLSNSNGELVTDAAKLKIAGAENLEAGQMATIVSLTILSVLFIASLPVLFAMLVVHVRKRRGGKRVNPKLLTPVVLNSFRELPVQRVDPENGTRTRIQPDSPEREIMSGFASSAPPVDPDTAREEAQAAFFAQRDAARRQREAKAAEKAAAGVGLTATAPTPTNKVALSL